MSGIVFSKETMSGYNKLKTAVENNQIDVVKLLVSQGYNVGYPDEYGVIPLHIACANGYVQMVTFLLPLTHNINHCDNIGWNCLFNSVIHGQYECAILCLNAGVNINHNIRGMTAMDLAMSDGDIKMINILK